MADEPIVNNEQLEVDKNNIEPEPITSRMLNYEELIKTDSELQKFIDKRISQATETARKKEAERQRILLDQQISEEARFKAMNKDEQIQELLRQKKSLEEQYERRQRADSLRRTVEDAFVEKQIPKTFASLVDYEKVTAENIQSIIDMFSEYEYHKPGVVDKLATEMLEKRLKQKPSETRLPSGEVNYQAQYDAAKKAGKTTADLLRIKREAFSKGVVVN